MSGLPPLPSDVTHPLSADDDAGADQSPPDGESYRELLRAAHWHIKRAHDHIRKALDTVDDVKSEKARRKRAAKLDIERRSRRFAIAANH